MARKLKLTLPLDELDNLHRRVAGKGGKMQVDKAVMSKLLVDHSAALAFMQKHGLEHEEPKTLEDIL